MKQFTRQTSGEAMVKLRTNIASNPKIASSRGRRVKQGKNKTDRHTYKTTNHPFDLSSLNFRTPIGTPHFFRPNWSVCQPPFRWEDFGPMTAPKIQLTQLEISHRCTTQRSLHRSKAAETFRDNNPWTRWTQSVEDNPSKLGTTTWLKTKKGIQQRSLRLVK